MGKEGYSLHFYPDDGRLDVKNKAVPASFLPKEKTVSRHHYALLPCILLLCFVWPCLAAEPQQDKRILCGEYSYILPEGFSAFDMPQYHKDKIYLSRTEYDGHSKAENNIICIKTENIDNKSFIIDNIRILRSSPKIKHDITFDFKKFEKQFKHGINTYYNAHYVYNGIINWSSILVEMDASGSDQHTILYFSSNNKRNIKKGRRTVTVEMSDEDLKKIALEFIESIQKVR